MSLPETKAVDAAVREYLRPILKKAGFARFENRTAWRHRAYSIDTVFIQCLGSTLVSDPDTTPFSFRIEIGGYLPCIPSRFPGLPRFRSGKFFPRVGDWHFEFPAEKFASHFYSIRPDGSNILHCVKQAAEVVIIHGLPWMNNYQDPDDALTSLQAAFVAHPSYVNSYMLGYVAKETGAFDIAVEHLQRAINSNRFEHCRPQLQNALRECRL